MSCGRKSHHLLPLVVLLRVSQLQHNWHFMLDNFLLWEPVLCLVGFLSLCIIRLHPLDTSSPSCSKLWPLKTYLELSYIPWGVKLPLVENSWGSTFLLLVWPLQVFKSSWNSKRISNFFSSNWVPSSFKYYQNILPHSNSGIFFQF